MATATTAAAERQSEGPVATTSHGLKGEEDATDDGEEVNNDDEERLGRSTVLHPIESAELVAAHQALRACQAECARLASEKTDALATAADLHHQLCSTLGERSQLDYFVSVLEADVKRLTESQTQAAIARHGAKSRQQKWEEEKRELLEIISKQRDDRVRLKAELSKAVEEKKEMKHKLARPASALPRVVEPEFDEATYKHAVSELVEERDTARQAHADLQKKVSTLEASVSSYSSTHLSLTSRLEAAESSSLATSKELDYALSLIDELVEEGSQLREEKYQLEARVRTMEEEKEKWEEETTGSIVRPRSTSRFLNA
ncbi:hypothetical protein JCM8097_001458 [Rhodosporidiobolus ruineniae]